MVEAPDIWTSCTSMFYFVPALGVFILAGVVYFLSFRTKDDASDQSLRIYLNVLSGDDDKNRKAKRLRKFGNNTRQKISANGNVDGENKLVDSDADSSSPAGTTILPTGFSAEKTAHAAKKVSQTETIVNAARSSPVVPEHLKITTPSPIAPELLIDENKTPSDEEISLDGKDVWHKATSRKDRKVANNIDARYDDTTNHSTTSDESRPSFKNSCSSRNSSPYRHRMTSSRKFIINNNSNRKTTTTGSAIKLQQLRHQQRPNHLKLDQQTTSLTSGHHQRSFSNGTGSFSASPPNIPAILLTRATENHLPFPFATSPKKISSVRNGHSYGDCFKKDFPPEHVDICIQTDETEDYPSPLEGLRKLDNGQPRFVIMMDFCAQVDLDVEECLEAEIVMQLDDSSDNKTNYTSNGSLSSGDGSTRVTPVLEEEPALQRSFRILTAEKSQSVHRRTVSDSAKSHYSTHHRPLYPQPLRPTDGSGDASGNLSNGDHYVGRGDLRTCRAEKQSNEWIDNSPRRTARPNNGRWRN